MATATTATATATAAAQTAAGRDTRPITPGEDDFYATVNLYKMAAETANHTFGSDAMRAHFQSYKHQLLAARCQANPTVRYEERVDGVFAALAGLGRTVAAAEAEAPAVDEAARMHAKQCAAIAKIRAVIDAAAVDERGDIVTPEPLLRFIEIEVCAARGAPTPLGDATARHDMRAAYEHIVRVGRHAYPPKWTGREELPMLP